jgi:hypothetical protein
MEVRELIADAPVMTQHKEEATGIATSHGRETIRKRGEATG